MMKQGLRVLAIGKSDSSPDELVFLGLIGISDPPRPSAVKGTFFRLAVALLMAQWVDMKALENKNHVSLLCFLTLWCDLMNQ